MLPHQARPVAAEPPAHSAAPFEGLLPSPSAPQTCTCHLYFCPIGPPTLHPPIPPASIYLQSPQTASTSNPPRQHLPPIPPDSTCRPHTRQHPPCHTPASTHLPHASQHPTLPEPSNMHAPATHQPSNPLPSHPTHTCPVCTSHKLLLSLNIVQHTHAQHVPATGC